MKCADIGTGMCRLDFDKASGFPNQGTTRTFLTYFISIEVNHM